MTPGAPAAVLLALLSGAAAGAPPAGAGAAASKVFLTVEEALRLAFPECEIQRRTHYLSDAELKRARELASADVASAIVYAYAATREGRVAGTAYFDTHRVRTLPETLMVAVDPAGRVARVEVLSFDEPLEYLPRGNWYGQFRGRALDEELRPRRGIQGVTGATLTARSTTEAVRRVLALHQVLQERAARGG